MDISDKQFDEIISQAIDELPEEYIKRISGNNVAIVYEDEPSPDQHKELKLRGNQDLLGLYEGIPMTVRGSGGSLALPDKITLFKKALLRDSKDLKDFKANVKHTLWHEIAHFYGLDHDRIYGLENKAGQ
jgi:predicted Zn-dependent protease with MMP-like domain